MANTGKIKNFYTIRPLVSFIEDRKKLVEYGHIVVVKKRCGIQTFFSTTTYAPIP